jgi:hypothetical protein
MTKTIPGEGKRKREKKVAFVFTGARHACQVSSLVAIKRYNKAGYVSRS